MKLISFRYKDKDRFGVVSGDGVVDASERLGGKYIDLQAAIAGGALDELARLAGQKPDVGLSEITYLKPISRADKIFCIGRNYDEYHEVVEDRKRPDYPSVFPRTNSSFVAHNEPILAPVVSPQLDYEAELVVVIGKTGRHVPEDKVFDHILGYTISNEGSVRDWQKKGSQNTPGKNFYRSGSIGPWIVTKDEIKDPNDVALKTWVDGELRQDGNTSEMIFHVPYLVAHISRFTQLEPGDMISTGSPGGSAVALPGKPWLKPGQTLEIEFAGIGRLKNPIVAEKA